MRGVDYRKDEFLVLLGVPRRYLPFLHYLILEVKMKFRKRSEFTVTVISTNSYIFPFTD